MENSESIDHGWCERHADQFGVGTETLHENLRGETSDTAKQVQREIIEREQAMRKEMGVQYTFRHFSWRRSLRNICNRRRLGGWKK